MFGLLKSSNHAVAPGIKLRILSLALLMRKYIIQSAADALLRSDGGAESGHGALKFAVVKQKNDAKRNDPFASLDCSVADKAGPISLQQGAEILDASHKAVALVGIAHQDLLVGILYHLRSGNHIHTLSDGLLD